MHSILQTIILAISLSQFALAVPAPAVVTSTRLSTITSCSCTSKSSSAGHTSTFTLSASSSCTSKKIQATCKTTTSTIKTTITPKPTSTSTKHTTTTSTTSSKPVSSISTSTRRTTTPSTSSSTTNPSSASSTTKPSTTSNSSTTTTSSSSHAPSGTPTPNTGHRGLAYNSPPLTLPFSLSNQSSLVSWSYNWYSLPYTIGQPQSGYNPALNFVPMLWSAAPDLTSVWAANVASSVAKYGTTAVLAFNEPDGCGGGGACMNLSSAVSGYQKWMDPLAGKVRLGAPAVTNGDSATMGLSYLRSFLAQCTGCRIDFVPIHWYGDAGDVAGFESYVGEAYEAAGGRPLWVTELGVTGGDAGAFLGGVAGWLDGDGRVERWAWFMDAAGNLINANGSGLSALGQVYNGGS